jgi:hypothetical protein
MRSYATEPGARNFPTPPASHRPSYEYAVRLGDRKIAPRRASVGASHLSRAPSSSGKTSSASIPTVFNRRKRERKRSISVWTRAVRVARSGARSQRPSTGFYTFPAIAASTTSADVGPPSIPSFAGSVCKSNSHVEEWYPRGVIQTLRQKPSDILLTR